MDSQLPRQGRSYVQPDYNKYALKFHYNAFMKKIWGTSFYSSGIPISIEVLEIIIICTQNYIPGSEES